MRSREASRCMVAGKSTGSAPSFLARAMRAPLPRRPTSQAGSSLPLHSPRATPACGPIETQQARREVEVNDGWVEASVLDHGPQPPAELPADAGSGELRAFGRGLWLLRRLVDEICLEGVKAHPCDAATGDRAGGYPRPLCLCHATPSSGRPRRRKQPGHFSTREGVFPAWSSTSSRRS
jgi:hypothetical protein